MSHLLYLAVQSTLTVDDVLQTFWNAFSLMKHVVFLVTDNDLVLFQLLAWRHSRAQPLTISLYVFQLLAWCWSGDQPLINSLFQLLAWCQPGDQPLIISLFQLLAWCQSGDQPLINSLFQLLAWRQSGDQPLINWADDDLVYRHIICVTQPQWINWLNEQVINGCNFTGQAINGCNFMIRYHKLSYWKISHTEAQITFYSSLVNWVRIFRATTEALALRPARSKLPSNL